MNPSLYESASFRIRRSSVWKKSIVHSVLAAGLIWLVLVVLTGCEGITTQAKVEFRGGSVGIRSTPEGKEISTELNLDGLLK